MNTTLTTQAEALKVFTVNELAVAAGVSETTARKFVKAELEADRIAVDAAAGRGKFAVAAPVPTGKKVYRKNPDAIRIIRKNRFTKAELTVQSLDELAMKDPFGHKAVVEEAIGDAKVSAKWVTVCLTHGKHTGSEYILDAWWKATHPAFCKDCRKQLPAEQIAAAKNLPSLRDSEGDDEGDE